MAISRYSVAPVHLDAKFDQLTAGRIDGELAKKIKEAVRSLDQIQVKDLTALLARVRVS